MNHLIGNTTQVDTLLEGVIGYLPGCNVQKIKAGLQLAALDFIRDTGDFIFPCGPCEFVANQHGYVVPSPFSKARVNNVIEVRTGIIGEEHWERSSPYNYRVGKDPCGNALITFNFSYATPGKKGWIAIAGLVPFDDCKEFPCEWFAKWKHAIVAGALRLFLSEQGTPYYNAVNAQANSMRYSQAVQDACYERLAVGSRNGQLSYTDEFETF